LEDIYNQIVTFITELDITVKILIVGIFTILGLLNFKNVISIYQTDVKSSSKIKLKLMPILLTVLFIFLAVFVASV